MSMQSLVSGAECTTASNPLSQVLKHTEGDRSLQKDRVEGSSSSRLRHLPPTAAGPANAADLNMARQFFDPGLQSSGFPRFQGPMPAAPHQMLESLHHAQRPMGVLPPEADLSPQHQFMNMHRSSTSLNWSEEFSQVPSGVVSNTMPRFNESQQVLNYPINDYAQINSAFFRPSYTPQVQLSYQGLYSADVKGKGKAFDLDFEEAFARAAASINTEKTRIVEVQDSTETLEAAFERAKLDEPKEDDELTDFQKVWDRLRNSEIPPPEDDLAKWESEFNQVMENQREDFTFGEDMERAWQNGFGDLEDDFRSADMARFDDDGIPILEPYKFETNNPYLAERTSHLARAKELLDQNGSLTEVALLLEAAIQQGELGVGGYETWILLGETRSMDEREEAAMRALTEGVRRAQSTDNNGEGMLSLAISYTNESFDRASYATLHRWLLAKFPSLVPEEFKGSLPSSPWASHDQATDSFLAVARQQHLQGHMDPDVQIGLGVLFYTNSEFDKAKDCFESALSARPKDYLLWNRLGSCLSNGSKPEEALGVYRHALELRPTYTRAIYNVGVACLNIGAHKEAAELFLSALAMQDSTGGDKSEQLWQTLKKCFISMDRNDLAEAANPGQSLSRFKQEGFDF